MKGCPCGRYRQLNSVLYPRYHILKWSKLIFNGLVLKVFSTCRQFESYGKPKVVLLFFLQNSTQIPSLEAFIIIYDNFLKYLFMKCINWERKGNFKSKFIVSSCYGHIKRLNIPSHIRPRVVIHM